MCNMFAHVMNVCVLKNQFTYPTHQLPEGISPGGWGGLQVPATFGREILVGMESKILGSS